MNGSSGWRRIAMSQEMILAVILAGLLAVASWLMPRFLEWQGQLNLSRQLWETALISMGMTLVIIAGGIDLSVGAIMGLCAIAFGICHQFTESVGWASAACLLTGIGCGACNGGLIAATGVHPLIVTLATMAAFRGMAEGISQGESYSRFGEDFARVFASQGPFGIAVGGWITVTLAIVLAVVLSQTRWGRYLRAVGGNERAAQFAGVPVERLKFTLYLGMGLLSACATLIYVARFDTAKADAGRGMELEVITAVVLGGTSVFGGSGQIRGTVLGLLLIHETRLFASRYWRIDELRQIVIGCLLIGAVAAYQAVRKSKV
jgi:rhamnose transport system permease protein